MNRVALLKKIRVRDPYVGLGPIWQHRLMRHDENAETEHLASLEENAINFVRNFLTVIEIQKDADDLVEIRKLIAAAESDLIAGCGLARLGYMKQAYSLWRSWFEQCLFALYFLDAPIHHEAWKVQEEVQLGDSPSYRLMLHQLLNESGEKHPFAAVYSARYTQLLAALKIGKIKSEQHLLKRSTRVLTLLSQGVHGTYRPAPVTNFAELYKSIGTHSVPALQAACETVTEYWLCYIVNTITLPEQMIISLRSGMLPRIEIHNAFTGSAEVSEDLSDEEVDALYALNKPFKFVFEKF